MFSLVNLPISFTTKYVTLVTHEGQAKDYYRRWGGRVFNVVEVPDAFSKLGMGGIREWITWHHAMEMAYQYIIMLDDDLKFYVRRRPDHPLYLRYTGAAENVELMRLLFRKLKKYAHVGVGPREGHNRVEDNERIVARNIRVTGLDLKVVHSEDIHYGRGIMFMEDFDFTLQLLRAGYPNWVSYLFAQGQDDSNFKGGCSSRRTLEVIERDANRLAELHPEFVKTVVKKNKGSWGKWEERTDVRIQWQKAYRSSQ